MIACWPLCSYSGVQFLKRLCSEAVVSDNKHRVVADCRHGMCAAVSAILQADGDYYTRDEIVQDYPHLRQL